MRYAHKNESGGVSTTHHYLSLCLMEVMQVGFTFDVYLALSLVPPQEDFSMRRPAVFVPIFLREGARKVVDVLIIRCQSFR